MQDYTSKIVKNWQKNVLKKVNEEFGFCMIRGIVQIPSLAILQF